MELIDRLNNLEAQIEGLERDTWQEAGDGISAVASASHMFEPLGVTGASDGSWPGASWEVVKINTGSDPLPPIAPFQLSVTGRALAFVCTHIFPGVWGGSEGEDFTVWMSIGYTSTAPDGSVSTVDPTEANSISLGMVIDPAISVALGLVGVYASGAKTLIIEEEPLSTISNLTVWHKRTGPDSGDGAIRGSRVSVINL